MIKKDKVVALIPARAGSKSIPKKNVIDILGKPLIYWTIKTALECKYIGRTIVSTDSEEIRKISIDAGAEAPFIRPKKLASDTAVDFGVFRHALEWLEKKENFLPELLVHLRPTGPARNMKLLERAIEVISNCEEADSLRSINLAKQTPYKMWKYSGSQFITPFFEDEGSSELHSSPRQILDKVYWQNGYVDIVKPRTIKKFKSMTGKKVLSFEINEDIVDLDYVEDIPKIENKLRELLSGKVSENPSHKPTRHSV